MCPPSYISGSDEKEEGNCGILSDRCSIEETDRKKILKREYYNISFTFCFIRVL